MLRPHALSAQDLLDKDNVNDEDSAGKDKENKQPRKGLCMAHTVSITKLGPLI